MESLTKDQSESDVETGSKVEEQEKSGEDVLAELWGDDDDLEALESSSDASEADDDLGLEAIEIVEEEDIPKENFRGRWGVTTDQKRKTSKKLAVAGELDFANTTILRYWVSFSVRDEIKSFRKHGAGVEGQELIHACWKLFKRHFDIEFDDSGNLLMPDDEIVEENQEARRRKMGARYQPLQMRGSKKSTCAEIRVKNTDLKEIKTFTDYMKSATISGVITCGWTLYRERFNLDFDDNGKFLPKG